MTAGAAAGRLYRTSPLERVLALRVSVLWEAAFYAAVFAAAFALRFWDLGSRALHHDESIHAQWAWNLLDYDHSPVFHGPFYYHVQGAVFFLFGSSDYTSRISPAIFGMGIVVLPLLLRRRLGVVGTAATVCFLAFSPTIVYYSRFMREDIFMAFFVLLMAVAMWRYIEEGRDRWLVVFALGFTGAVTSKEGAFLAIAAFLVFLDLYAAALLARQTLTARGLDTTWRRFVLAGALAPWAWVIAGLWPFLGGLRKNLDWEEKLPRPADVLILLMTFTFVLLTPAVRPWLLEPLGILDKDRLNWQLNLQGSIGTDDRLALAGIFAMTISIAAFVGLQWRAGLWSALFAGCGFIYLTLMTTFWTNMDGLVSGPWGSLDYWLTQQDAFRGDQPWYYYDLLMPAYEFLPLVICIGGAWWSIVRGDAFSRFLWVWLVGMWAGLSWGSEKMPWLNTHLALPACVLAGWTVARAWRAWRDRPATNTVVVSMLATGAVALGALALMVFLPEEPVYHMFRVAIALLAVGVVVYSARPYGRTAVPAFAAVAVVGALSLFSVRTMILVTFERGDVPQDMLIYTQSSPDIPDIMADIDRLAAATGKGHNLRIAVDSKDSYAWPWAWYLRDYNAVAYPNLSNGFGNAPGEPIPEYDVMLVHKDNVPQVKQALIAQASTQFGEERAYQHRWWFDEQYKAAMTIEGTQACTGQYGDCGPFRVPTLDNPLPIRTATWKHIFTSTPGWLDTWYGYWRDHDADALFGGTRPDSRCASCGSTDGVAFFPANFDLELGRINPEPVEIPGPRADPSGNPVFGSQGTFPGQFSQPVDIEQDDDGNLYVIDSISRRLQKFDAEGNFIKGVSIRQDPANLEEAAEPWGLAIGPEGQVAVADTFGWRVRVFDSNLEFTGVEFGEPPTNTDDPTDEQLFGPRDIAFDADGNMWVTDTGHARIQVFSPEGEFVRSIGSRGDGPGQFDEPVGIAIADDGTVFVADMYNSRVVMLNADGSFRASFAVEGWGGNAVFDKPYLEPLPDGRLAVGLPQMNEVRIYDRDGSLVGAVAPGDEPLMSPYGLLYTVDGKLWVVEGGSGRVRLFPVP